MISAILFRALVDALIVVDTLTLAPSTGRPLVPAQAGWLAAFSAFCLPVELSSSIEEAVCWQSAGLLFGAVGQVVVALAICALAAATPSAFSRTLDTP